MGRLKEELAELQYRFEKLEQFVLKNQSCQSCRCELYEPRRRANSDKYIYEDTEGSTEFSEALDECYLQKLNISFNQPKDDIMEVSVNTIVIED